MVEIVVVSDMSVKDVLRKRSDAFVEEVCTGKLDGFNERSSHSSHETIHPAVEFHSPWFDQCNCSFGPNIVERREKHRKSLRLSLVNTDRFQYGKKSLPTTQWFSQPMTINSLSVLNVNVYAAQNLDRAHLNSLQISITNYPIVTLNNQSDDLEQWTVDKDTAFQIGWDQNIVPRVKQTLIQQAQQVSSDDHLPRRPLRSFSLSRIILS